MSGAQVRVRVGGEQYALPVEHVYEVVDLGELTPVPGSADSVLGLLNLNGEIVPTFDLARILQIEREGRPRRLLVTECDSPDTGADIATEGVRSPHGCQSPKTSGTALGGTEGEFQGPASR